MVAIQPITIPLQQMTQEPVFIGPFEDGMRVVPAAPIDLQQTTVSTAPSIDSSHLYTAQNTHIASNAQMNSNEGVNQKTLSEFNSDDADENQSIVAGHFKALRGLIPV